MADWRSTLNTPIGTLELIWNDDGVRMLAVRERADQHRRARQLDGANPTGASPWDDALQAWFEQADDAIDQIPIAPTGTPFQRRVWSALRSLRVGQTISYGALAAEVDRPGAARAVGNAVGANPLLVLIPCHRVLAAGGQLGGFSAGLERKRWLLRHERARFRDSAPSQPQAVYSSPPPELL
ncbi:MAG: methylated-DNA--[protein]-cysteine S-methyltransferase [Candidatus Dadabacteria bacterium]|nr:MAG: methylated-DNA--[protein]-cysteine S-methyltransferase [Candidatus Dadabacteria bacterium]